MAQITCFKKGMDKEIMYDTNNYTLIIKPNAYAKTQLQGSLFNNKFYNPNREKFKNQVVIATAGTKVLWEVKPYQEDPYAKKFTAALSGEMVNDEWVPPQEEPDKTNVSNFKTLMEDFNNVILPNIIMNMPNDDKGKSKGKELLFKTLKLLTKDKKMEDVSFEDIRSVIMPSIKYGEKDDKIYNPEFGIKLRMNINKDTGETGYELELYDENGKIIKNIVTDASQILHELPQGTQFLATIIPSVWVKDGKISVLWHAQEVCISYRPSVNHGPKKSTFAEELYNNIINDDETELDSGEKCDESHDNNINDSSEEEEEEDSDEE